MKCIYEKPVAEVIDLVALEKIALLGSARSGGNTTIPGASGSVGDADDDEY